MKNISDSEKQEGLTIPEFIPDKMQKKMIPDCGFADLEENIIYLRRYNHISIELKSSDRNVRGRIKNVYFKLLKMLAKPILKKQNRYNLAVQDTILQMYSYITFLEKRQIELEKQLSELEGQK